MTKFNRVELITFGSFTFISEGPVMEVGRVRQLGQASQWSENHGARWLRHRPHECRQRAAFRTDAQAEWNVGCTVARDRDAGFGLDHLDLWTGEFKSRRREPHEWKAEIDMAMRYVPDETKRDVSNWTMKTACSIDLEWHMECGPFSRPGRGTFPPSPSIHIYISWPILPWVV